MFLSLAEKIHSSINADISDRGSPVSSALIFSPLHAHHRHSVGIFYSQNYRLSF
jgi:hypothetical protein